MAENRTSESGDNERAEMRLESDIVKIESFMVAMGKQVRGKGRIYLTGGATAVLYGWRGMTIDIDIKPDPEPAGLFEAIALRPLGPQAVRATGR